jgi:competence protein ComFC
LKKDERFENIREAFGIKKGVNIKNKKIILIDDVTTTGATLQEASKLLKKFDIDDIKLLTLAKSHI